MVTKTIYLLIWMHAKLSDRYSTIENCYVVIYEVVAVFPSFQLLIVRFVHHSVNKTAFVG